VNLDINFSQFLLLPLDLNVSNTFFNVNLNLNGFLVNLLPTNLLRILSSSNTDPTTLKLICTFLLYLRVKTDLINLIKRGK
jgi:hypothetical protein